jgi:hypothetical protein
LVAEAHALGSIAVIRSLGQAGFRVHAASSVPDALGFHSAYADRWVLHKPYNSGGEFLDWFEQYVRENQIQAIIPSEGLLIALRPVYGNFAHLIPFGPSPEVIFRALSKYDLFCLLSASVETACHLPPTLLVHDTADLPCAKALEILPFPVFIKADAVYSKNGSAGCTRRCDSLEETQREIEKLAGQFRKMIVQGYVPGQGVGAFFLPWKGEICAEFMHRRLHEVPHSGGVSSFRESWFDARIREDALLKLEKMGFEGVAMLEYRWNDITGDYHLIEVNSRFWGSLHLALFAGVDFPAMLVNCHLGYKPEPVKQWKQVSSRYTFPREVEYVWSMWKDPAVKRLRKLKAVGEFFLLGARPGVRTDLMFPKDSGLYWKAVARTIKTRLNF